VNAIVAQRLDPNLVSCAGVVPVMHLAADCGLAERIGEQVTVAVGWAPALGRIAALERVAAVALAALVACTAPKPRPHACDLQVRSPAGHVMIMRWPRDSST
jgi:hypothetical protein